MGMSTILAGNRPVPPPPLPLASGSSALGLSAESQVFSQRLCLVILLCAADRTVRWQCSRPPMHMGVQGWCLEKIKFLCGPDSVYLQTEEATSSSHACRGEASR